ncbi:dicer-like protein 2 [Lindgomyces ingoldianus]|uniref:Dicer-like protein 2 n=1 Tax=Lindgomyces ingoldianus TaxID=673940 RepID=A0ACB6Q959_9PLEO|nr:dicer-like protein 2 [Lindgomyces ingoldianus]KAF2463456.1 dicer-like protein 2 [Lindgomyces ingoldianus]
MSTDEEPLDGGATVIAGLDGESFRLRSYQAEMVEESLKANIIVAMDTGSGKTHIALARAVAELELCDPNQLVWFLAPTVTLCNQQLQAFQSHLPAYGIQALTGNDGVEHWSDQNTWDSALKNTRIVLSTHQVLLDALTHAFITMNRLALIIFDEAHHCSKNHPASRIMSQFYKPLLQRNRSVHIPRILGLSASPVMGARASSSDLEKIEANMNSIAKSPKIHRSELLRFVHRPELIRIPYPALPPSSATSTLLSALEKAYYEYDMKSDPYVADLLEKKIQGVQSSIRQLDRVITAKNPYCRQQLKTMVSKGKAMMDELGSSPTEWYLQQCISKFQRTAQSSSYQLLLDWSSQEKRHLCDIFKRMSVSQDPDSMSISLDHISPKVDALVDVLESEASPEFTGLVFVEQRVWVSALAEILSLHPRTAPLFNIGTFVGTSISSKRKTNVADLAEPLNQQNTLDEFRARRINLILATSVLEEGIDVSSCHLVICFERPKDLKSFVQRRGRARKQESKYIIFVPEAGSHRSPATWEAMEEEMKAAYLNDLRKIEVAKERELYPEDSSLLYQVPSTGALLTLDNASQHLHHFCALLGAGPYIDLRPQFTLDELADSRIMAKVTLPISVHPAVRTARSSESWLTERNAKNDAAFQAYKALHLAGLVNDNLLPSREKEGDDHEFSILDHTPSVVEVSPALDPWVSVAKQQLQNPRAYHRVLLKLTAIGEQSLHMLLLMPYQMPQIPDIVLHWNDKKRYSVESSPFSPTILTDEEITTMRAITRNLLHSAFPGRMTEERDDFLWLFVPNEPGSRILNHDRLHQFNISTTGHHSASDLIQKGDHEVSNWGLVNLQGDARKYMLKNISNGLTDPSLADNFGSQLQVIRAPKRRDFLHPLYGQNPENVAYTRLEWVNTADCAVDKLPASYSIFALFIPSILHQYEIYMTTEILRTTLLKPLSFDSSRLSLLLTATTASSTSESDNYQRLEFLGDCILKFIASVHVMAANLTWPESWLTSKKGKIVSNGFLARATLAAGLDKFIITKQFTGARWQPRYAEDVLKQEASNENKSSSKRLADVVESLLGASYLEGGFDKALVCAQTLLPLENWTPIPDANAILFSAAPCGIEINSLSTLEKLIGYTFVKKMLLLEAMTHASYTGQIASCSYERLEFLGDAVLDYIISKRLFAHKPELSHQTMHSIRASLVNAAFLAFRMFDTTVCEEMTNKQTFEPETVHRALWQFLRHNNPQLLVSQAKARAQHQEAREQVERALRHESKFPWHIFAQLDAPKSLSDIVESVIGAVYIDSKGDVEACEYFVRRLGILENLDRILRDEVDCLHPKERLGHLAVEKSVQYVNVDENEDTEGEGNADLENRGRRYRCQVKIGGQDVGGVVEGLKKLNAETIAAWKAVRIIEGVDDVAMSTCSDEEWHDAEDGGGVALEDDW